MKKIEPRKVARLAIEKLEERIAPISDQGLNMIAQHRPFSAPPYDPPPDGVGNA